MTKEEIKAIIAQKIEGQGTNLDAASVLPTILNWLVDHASEGIPVATEETVGGVKVGAITEGWSWGVAGFYSTTVDVGDEQHSLQNRIAFKTIDYYPSVEITEVDKEEFAEDLGIGIEDVDLLFQGAFIGLNLWINNIRIYLALTRASSDEVVYGWKAQTEGQEVVFENSGGRYSAHFYEV